ncbi:hypothetical protein [Spiroplasma taiwanense]|uniref:Uncharacterized protein n=1 Tax=Spiroplasma taiwanense CT-1 TaxID=1276220 RepID=S5MI97_9MOLU|nr:hypothetical protein [Spiroplasma taiwanense]AGR41620.1 hypothetical protein STAIW_v1c10370 [Spiroplasma taiwanense CT-1]
MKKIKLDDIALNAWSNALLCHCGDEKDIMDAHRICLVCQEPMDFNSHYSVENNSKSWNIKFYNNENYNENNFSGITMAVHKECLI